MEGAKLPDLLKDFHDTLKNHRYFRNNAEDLVNTIMENTAMIVFQADTPVQALYEFHASALDQFPHSTLPYGAHASQKELNTFVQRTHTDIDNEAHYNVMMLAFTDTARANMIQNKTPVRDIRAFENETAKLLAI